MHLVAKTVIPNAFVGDVSENLLDVRTSVIAPSSESVRPLHLGVPASPHAAESQHRDETETRNQGTREAEGGFNTAMESVGRSPTLDRVQADELDRPDDEDQLLLLDPRSS